MSSKRYTKEFKVEAVKQVTDRGHSARKSPPGWSCRSTAFTLGGNSTAAPDRRRPRRRTGPKRCAGSGRSLAGLRKERDILKKPRRTVWRRKPNAIHRAQLAGLPEGPRLGQQHEPARQLS